MQEAQGNLFSSVPSEDVFKFFNPQGRPDAQKITSALGYQRKDVAAAVGMPLNKVRLESQRIPKELLDRVVQWGIALNLVASFFQDKQKTILWFGTPNPMLGDISPRDMIRIGRFKKLLKFIRTALAENVPG